jgi:hypothetical protein
MNKYVATVRINGQLVKTLVFASNAIHARLLIQYQFGMNSISINPTKTEDSVIGYALLDDVIKAHKPLTPQQQRIKSLQSQKDNVSKQLKAERDKQKVIRAQQQIQLVRSQKIPS